MWLQFTDAKITVTSTPAPSIPFLKMHGTGNDFVVLDGIGHPLPADFNFPAAAEKLCRHHFGSGSDGLLLLDNASSPAAAIRMRMWNPDGSEDMCGNGLRCIIRLAQHRGYVTENHFTVETLAGLRGAELLPDGRIRVAMGQPILAASEIPIDLDKLDSDSCINYTVPSPLGPLHCSTLSTGSTHTVVWLEDELSEEFFQSFSPGFETDSRFPERTSIMWARVKSRGEIAIRIWERGVGETLACGTGACATAVAAQLTGRCDENVRIVSKGGTLQIEWKQPTEITMTGDALIVYEGSYLS